MDCHPDRIILLLRAVLPHLIDVAWFFALSKDSRAEDARLWAKRGKEKPFHVSLWLNLGALLAVASAPTEQMNELRGTILRDTHAFLEVVKETFIAFTGVRRAESGSSVSVTVLQHYETY
jgi:hypothetical protein